MTTDHGDLEETTAGDESGVRAAVRAVEQGTQLGRYVVLSQLGAGGMGVVYAAYDAELDRKVAIKVLRARSRYAPAGSSDGRTRLLREAQALAKLAHPNVVAVHDVGTRDDEVWIAMEFVEGRTLGEWSSERPRSWTEVVDVVVSAGRGLAAAHATGLLHRDFKPDNVMVSADGRVRVMDFGLARSGREREEGSDAIAPDRSAAMSQASLSARMTVTGAMMGTPAYMAPEQMSGRADERSDQFSLSVTLWQALYGERPFAGETLPELAAAIVRGELRTPPTGHRVPGWLRRVCARGLATDPAARFASVDALLAALEQGRGRGRRLRIVAAVASVAVLIGGVELSRRWAHARRIDACDHEGAAMVATWDDAARARVRTGLLATGAADAATTADKVMPWLDAHAAALREHTSDACVRVEVTHSWDAETGERARWCLEERRLDRESLVAQLEVADAHLLRSAVPAAAQLAPVSPCMDATVLAALPAPPTAVDRERLATLRADAARIDALRVSGKRAQALALLETTREQAIALSWPAFEARLYDQEGALRLDDGTFAQSEAASVEAYVRAAKAGAWGVAASAATRLVAVVGYRQSRHADGRLWARLSEIAESFAGDPLGLREATRLGHVAAIEFETGAYDESVRLGERALQLRMTALGEDHPELATTLANLAVVYEAQGRHDEAEATARRALAIQEAAFGGDSPEVARTLNNLGLMLRARGRKDEARALIERGLAIRERVLEPQHADIATSLNSLAGFLLEVGEVEQARQHYERALRMRGESLGTDHPEYARSLNNLAGVHLAAKELERARDLFERAMAVLERADGHDERTLGLVGVNLGSIYVQTGAPERAVEVLETAIERLTRTAGADQPKLVFAYDKLGHALLELRRFDDAVAALRRSLELAASASPPSDDPYTRFALAQALMLVGRERDEAIVQARRAREILGEDSDEDAVQLRADIDAWLGGHADVARGRDARGE